MAIGDGIRRDIAKVSQAERDRFIAAILQLDTAKFYGDGVSCWDKQEDLHKNAHLAGVGVHAGPGFPVSKIGLRGVALHPGEEARIRPLSTRARMSPGAREPRVPRA